MTKASSGHSDLVRAAVVARDQGALVIAHHLAAHPRVRVESTWEWRARWGSETAPAALNRLSVGTEPVADLITDIDQSLQALR